jgi:hypothetical protein
VLNSLHKNRVVSTIQTMSTQLIHVGEKSFLYRWVTADPEPKIVVINLKETWTLGPVLSRLNHLVEEYQPYWRESILNTALSEVNKIINNADKTRVCQFLSRALLPPESPSSADDQEES